jgi:hypothetical protein
MKYVFASIYTIWVIFSGHAYINFDVPEDYIVTNTWAKNGVLTVVDKYGNGADVDIVRGVDFGEAVKSLKDEWGPVLKKQPYEIENVLIFSVEVTDKINPVEKIILIEKDGFLVKACLYKTGASHSHGAFESDVITMLKGIRKGESYEKAWNVFLPDFLHRAESGGGQG